MFLKRLTIVIAFACMLSLSNAQINFGLNQTYSYLKGADASSISGDWVNTEYDDSSWSSAQAPFRYGDGSGGTHLADMQGSYTTIYLRNAFIASNINRLTKINLNANYDDGFIIWINGDKVLSVNAPDNPTYNSTAQVNHESGSSVAFEIDSTLFTLIEGKNIIALQVFNVSLTSSDFYFDMSIYAEPELPVYDYDTTAIISHEAGIYNNPFIVTLESPSSEFNILYTIDGSDPRVSETMMSANTSSEITIDPKISTGRGITPAFILRASLQKEGYQPSLSITKTYLFLDQVAKQKNPGYTWPSGDVNRQAIDYAMAADVTENEDYAGHMQEALLQIPSVSLVTDPGNLFDSEKGIYVNSEQKGKEWERSCSFELINTDGTPAFQVNAGLRIRGGNSAKNKNNPKHAFRLFFRSEYGAGKLKFPLFGDEGADEFDAIDLRCEQNYSWSMDGSYHNTMIKDIFCRDLQGKTGQPYKRGRYYHLYLNGMYWGIFQTDERSEASYAETYLGGDKEDYDVIKVDTRPWPYYCEATDGNMEAWNELWDHCQNGFTQNVKYFGLQGLDENGKPDSDLTKYVDVENLIDYMLVIFYSGNFDAPVSSWYGDDMPNNFYAIYNRKNKSEGFKFLAHDSEHSMFVEEVFGRNGIYENRVNIGSNGSMRITNELNFNPQWLHFRLTQNKEYQQKFIDRAYELLDEGGILSEDSTKALFKKRADQIDMAIIAESARWGDAQTSASLTKNDDWKPEVQTMLEDFFPYRTNILVQQLKNEGLYSDIKAPVIIKSGNKLLGPEYSFTGLISITVENPNTYGTLYYTTNNTDPREIGGNISDAAKNGNNSISIQLAKTMVITARAWNNNHWGPVKKMIFNNISEDFSTFKVTEVHYHPGDIFTGQDTISGKKYEFIEFKNTGTHTINLSGLTFASGIEYSFPEYTLLDPGRFYVIASKPNYFFERYGVYPSGNFSNQLNNGGELIKITTSEGDSVLAFTYKDNTPWPVLPDGLGYTLTTYKANPTGDPNSYLYWKSSSAIHGTPFANDFNTTIHPVTAGNNSTLSVFPNPASVYTQVTIKGIPLDSEIGVAIYTPEGKMVYNNTILNNTKIYFTSFNIKPGVYFIRTTFNNYSDSEKIVIMPE